MSPDRNFDDLAHRFRRNVYSSLKGRIRLAVLERDFADFLPAPTGTRRVLDAGGGQGLMARHFAACGDQVLLCDISSEMLAIAEDNLREAALAERVELRHGAIQEIGERNFDLIVCHAVLEWVAEPQALLRALSDRLRPGGHLSLLYYNLNGLVYKNLLRTNFRKIRQRKWRGYRGSLTPTNPLRPEDVSAWLAELPLQVLGESGVRVFHDYIFSREDRERDPEALIEMEIEHSRQAPYQRLGRYIHLVCRKAD